MEIPGYTKFSKCPRTPDCTRKAIWRRDDTGELFHVNQGVNFVEHNCTVRGSKIPEHVYIGEFYNKRTGRTRWVGPERLQRSAEKPPKDITSPVEDWEHKGTMIGTIDWKPVKES